MAPLPASGGKALEWRTVVVTKHLAADSGTARPSPTPSLTPSPLEGDTGPKNGSPGEAVVKAKAEQEIPREPQRYAETDERLSIRIPAEVGQLLREKAKKEGLTLVEYLEEVAGREAYVGGPNDAIKLAVERLINRTPEEVLADRERILAKTPPPRPLPEGKTLNDVVEGTWPGDETDEEINKALEELS